MLESASLKARNKQMPLKRKPEDELPLPEKAVKKTKASSAADGDHGDYDKPEDGFNAARPKQNSWQKWLEDSILHSGESLQEVIGEDSVEEFDQGESLQEVVGEDSVEEFDQGDKGKGKEEEVDVDTEGIGKPCESKQTWESKGSFDPILDIYTLNEAVQLQRDLENLESELLVIRDRIPWDKFKQKLCKRCNKNLVEHLQAEDRRRQVLASKKHDDVEIRPSLGFLGDFDYFLGLPTLEELAEKQRDIEMLRMMRPLSQKYDLEKLGPNLCGNCDKYRKSAKIRAPAPPYLNPAIQRQPSTAAPKPPPKDKTPITISSDPEDSPVHEPAEQSKKNPSGQKPAPASVPGPSQPPVAIYPPKIQPKALQPLPASDPKPGERPVPMDPPKTQPKVPKPAPASVPEPSQLHVPIDPPKIQPKALQPVPASVPGPSQPPVQIHPPQKAPTKNVPTKEVTSNKAPTPEPITPNEPQPPVQDGRPKRKGPAPKVVRPEEPQPPVQKDRPKRKGLAPKQVAPKEPQRPAPGGKPKKKDPTPGPSAPKDAEPIQPAVAKKPSKKPDPTSKKGNPAPPTSPEPATQTVNKTGDHIEQLGPIQRVMGDLPEKPKGHDYYCAICYTNLTRMGSAKKLEHVEKCETTLGEVKVMTKAQAQSAKTGK